MQENNQRGRQASAGGGVFKTMSVVILTIVLVCCLLVVACAGVIAFLGSLGSNTTVSTDPASKYHYETTFGDDESSSKFLSIQIAGPILTNSDSEGAGFSLFGNPAATYGYDVKEQLYRAAEDESIDGIILEINSPGGTITGSKAISDGVEYYREKAAKPIIAHCSNVCASGSYWSAISSDHVIIDYGSITGSIGVIFGPFQYYDGVIAQGSLFGNIVTENGIETKYFTGGQYKDNGSPYRKLAEEEIQIIQEDIDNEYDAFVKYVTERRDISDKTVREDIKALVYGNKNALEYKLADEEGSREFAYAELAKRGGISNDDYKIVREATDLGFWGDVFGASSIQNAPQSQQVVQPNQRQTCQLCGVPSYYHGDPSELGY